MTPENQAQFQREQYDDSDNTSPAEMVNQTMDDERTKLCDAITNLSKIATLTIADTYSTEVMGVEFAPGRDDQIRAERDRLNQSLGEASKLWAELNNTLNEVQRATGSLQFLIDPENN